MKKLIKRDRGYGEVSIPPHTWKMILVPYCMVHHQTAGRMCSLLLDHVIGATWMTVAGGSMDCYIVDAVDAREVSCHGTFSCIDLPYHLSSKSLLRMKRRIKMQSKIKVFLLLLLMSIALVSIPVYASEVIEEQPIEDWESYLVMMCFRLSSHP